MSLTMSKEKKAPFIALFGGSFDPIHSGHLQIGEIVRGEVQDSEIYFIPCGQAVHRPVSKTPAQHRLAMLKLALAHQKNFHLDTYEIDAQRPSYTINTLRYFRQHFPQHSLGFILGMDTFLSLDTAWGDHWQNLLDYVHLLVLPRAGVLGQGSLILQQFLKKYEINDQDFLHKQRYGGIMLLKETPALISSTAIRKKLAEHENVAPLLPEAVYDYIQRHQLYR